MSTPEERKAAAAARQAKLLAKGKDRLAKITGAAKDEGRVLSDGKQPINHKHGWKLCTSNAVQLSDANSILPGCSLDCSD